ncbi:hypothetical protein E3N88_17938 [Mikania micrantha]|uniref:Endonuclease/exonuclease/phosphatase domain-containing protein n=1 Tax=Mikania micrantha TaxID=192012 RepID=A0A5N6NT81_9ASTR|nr:hypothetical protein E3N88_17938 [Mikania micrantha]
MAPNSIQQLGEGEIVEYHGENNPPDNQRLIGLNDVEIGEEVENTVRIAECVGIHLLGLENEVQEELLGEGHSEVDHVINVYAPQDLNGKQMLWDKLGDLMNYRSGVWILLGDFNEVRNAFERLNSEFNFQGASNFNNFIFSNQLMEYNMEGARFTCMKGLGEKFSKLDRFLVNDIFINKWPNAVCKVLERKYSDHCPIILVTTNIDFGATPFRFFSSWFNFAAHQRKLNNENSDKPAKVIKNFEAEAEVRALTDQEITTWAKKEWQSLELIKKEDARQKARAKWSLEGDEISAFLYIIYHMSPSDNKQKIVLRQIFKFKEE